VLIGKSVSKVLKAKSSQISGVYHVVDHLNAEVRIEACILPNVAGFPRVKIAGALPLMHANLSDTKYKRFMKILDVILPKSSSKGQSPGQSALKSAAEAEKGGKQVSETSQGGMDMSTLKEFGLIRHDPIPEIHEPDDGYMSTGEGDDSPEVFYDAPELTASVLPLSPTGLLIPTKAFERKASFAFVPVIAYVTTFSNIFFPFSS
jgi:uncharacterized protein with beta-barrel porin domain